MRWFIVFFALLGMSGCASTYEDAVSVSRIGNDMALVKAQGNAFTNRSQTDRYALVRAAEETLAAGYSYFEVLDLQSTYLRVRNEADAEKAANYGTLRRGDRIETSKEQNARSAAPAYQPMTQYQIRMHRDYPDHPEVRHFYSAKQVIAKYDRKVKFD